MHLFKSKNLFAHFLSKNIICIVYILFASLLSGNGFCENYFISNSGNDSNDGLSPARPWKSFEKLNTLIYTIKSGDAVFFERGGYYSGQINLNSKIKSVSDFIIGAYGEGNNPVISASVPVKNWKHYKNGIYSAEVNSEVKNFFVNGKQMILARYPNSGFLKIQKPLQDAHTGFTDPTLKQPKDYWNGSIARIRTINWAYEYSPVKSFSGGTIRLAEKTEYPVMAEWGYYLDNNLNELDTAGEWFFEKTKKGGGILYYQPGKNQDINNIIAEACIYDYAVFSGSMLQNVQIQDLDFKYQFENAIWLVGNQDNVLINNCRFSGQFKIGIHLSVNSINCKINNCRFYDICGKSINILQSVKTIISNNIFVNTGMIPGYGTTGEAFGMSGIVILNSDSNHIFKNLIINTGHDGINSIGRSNVIEKNVIMNSMLLMNDGSAIKCYGTNTSNSVWRNNFIFYSPGNMEGTYLKYNHIAASGIYLDDKTNNMKIYGNTVEDCGLSGINLNNGCRENQIYNNLCYSNGAGINFYQGVSEMKNNYVIDNIFCGLNSSQLSVQMLLTTGFFKPALFKGNYFVNPVSDAQFLIQTNGIKEVKNFAQWKENLNQGEESNSVLLTGNDYKFSKVFYNMSDDSITVILDGKSFYKDIHKNSVHGSVVIPSWSSELLFSEKDLKNTPSLNFINGPLYFGKIKEGENSSAQWFCLRGNNLTEPVTITAPEGFKLSLSETENYVKILTILPDNKNVFNVIYVRFIPESENNFYNYIKINSGSTDYSIKVTGNSRK